MFYVSVRKDRLFGVTDTNDNVTEFYSFAQLKEITSSGIKILGVSDSYATPVKKVGKLILYADTQANKLYIVDTKSNGCVTFDCNKRVTHTRNNPILEYVSLVKNIGSRAIIRCAFCVKFDYENTGLYYLVIDTNTGCILRESDELIFVNDDYYDVNNQICNSCGDCPDFITSEEATKFLKRKGIKI